MKLKVAEILPLSDAKQEVKQFSQVPEGLVTRMLAHTLFHGELAKQIRIRPQEFFAGHLEDSILSIVYDWGKSIVDASNYVPMRTRLNKQALYYSAAATVLEYAGHKIVQEALLLQVLKAMPIFDQTVSEVPVKDKNDKPTGETKQIFDLRQALDDSERSKEIVNARAVTGSRDKLNASDITKLQEVITKLATYEGISHGARLDPSEYDSIFKRFLVVEKAIELALFPSKRSAAQNDLLGANLPLYEDAYIAMTMYITYLTATRDLEMYEKTAGPIAATQQSAQRFSVMASGGQKLAWLYTGFAHSFSVATIHMATALQKNVLSVLEPLGIRSSAFTDCQVEMNYISTKLDAINIPYVNKHAQWVLDSISKTCRGNLLLPLYVIRDLGLENVVQYKEQPIDAGAAFDGRVYNITNQVLTDYNTIDDAISSAYLYTKLLRSVVDDTEYQLSAYLPLNGMFDANPFQLPDDMFISKNFNFENDGLIKYRSIDTPSFLPNTIDRFNEKGEWYLKDKMYKTVRLSQIMAKRADTTAPSYYWSGAISLPTLRKAIQPFLSAPIPANYYKTVWRDHVSNHIDPIRFMFREKSQSSSGQAYFESLLRLIHHDKFMSQTVINALASMGFVYRVNRDTESVERLVPSIPTIYGHPVRMWALAQKIGIKNEEDSAATMFVDRFTKAEYSSSPGSLSSFIRTWTVENGTTDYIFALHTRVPQMTRMDSVPFKWDETNWISLPISRQIVSAWRTADSGAAATISSVTDSIIDLQSLSSDDKMSTYRLAASKFHELMTTGKLSLLYSEMASPGEHAFGNTVVFMPKSGKEPLAVFEDIIGWSPTIIDLPHLFFQMQDVEEFDYLRSLAKNSMWVEVKCQYIHGRSILWRVMQQDEFWLPEAEEEDSALREPFRLTSDYSVKLESVLAIGPSSGAIKNAPPVAPILPSGAGGPAPDPKDTLLGDIEEHLRADTAAKITEIEVEMPEDPDKKKRGNQKGKTTDQGLSGAEDGGVQ